MVLAAVVHMQAAQSRNRSKWETQPRINTEATTGRQNKEKLSERGGVKGVYQGRETLSKREGRRSRAYAKSLSQLLCDSRTLFQSLLPSTLIHPAATILYRPIWIKRGMNWSEWERESKPERGEREM